MLSVTHVLLVLSIGLIDIWCTYSFRVSSKHAIHGHAHRVFHGRKTNH